MRSNTRKNILKIPLKNTHTEDSFLKKNLNLDFPLFFIPIFQVWKFLAQFRSPSPTNSFNRLQSHTFLIDNLIGNCKGISSFYPRPRLWTLFVNVNVFTFVVTHLDPPLKRIYLPVKRVSESKSKFSIHSVVYFYFIFTF